MNGRKIFLVKKKNTGKARGEDLASAASGVEVHTWWTSDVDCRHDFGGCGMDANFIIIIIIKIRRGKQILLYNLFSVLFIGLLTSF